VPASPLHYNQAVDSVNQITQTVNQVLPILFLIFLGNLIRRREFLTEDTVEGLRKLVVNFALPSVLFTSFLGVQLQWAHLIFFGVTFVLCIFLYWLGRLLQKALGIQHAYFPFLVTGFEYGMLGISLFGTAYGLKKIGYIAVVDLGHEIFIWFVFLALLLVRRDGISAPRQLMTAFFKSPVIVAILAGIALNVVGVRDLLHQLPVTGAVLATLQFLGNLTTPLILVIVGYGIRFDRQGSRDALIVIVTRLVILIPLALALNIFLIRGLLGLERAFEAALFTLFVLPPPFIVPLYMRQGMAEERGYVNNVLTLHTVVSIAVFTVYFALNPEI
jgi:predicted permease